MKKLLRIYDSLTWAGWRATGAFIESVTEDLPDEYRTIWYRLILPQARVQAWGPDKYRWTCPDPNFKWHYNVDDCGDEDSWYEAIKAAKDHWYYYHLDPVICGHMGCVLHEHNLDEPMSDHTHYTYKPGKGYVKIEEDLPHEYGGKRDDYTLAD